MQVTPGKILSHQKLFNSVIILKNEDTQQYVWHSQKSRRSFRKFAVLWQHKRIVSNSSVDLNGRIRIRGGHHSWPLLQILCGLISDLMLADLCYRFDAGWSLLQIWCWLNSVTDTMLADLRYRSDAGWYWYPLQIRCCSTDTMLADLRYRFDTNWCWFSYTDSMLVDLCFRFDAVWSPLHIWSCLISVTNLVQTDLLYIYFVQADHRYRFTFLIRFGGWVRVRTWWWSVYQLTTHLHGDFYLHVEWIYWKRPTLFCCRLIWLQLHSPLPLLQRPRPPFPLSQSFFWVVSLTRPTPASK